MGAHAKPETRTRGAVFVGIGPTRPGAVAGSKAPRYGEAPPIIAATPQPRVVEAEAPQRPWCDNGKVLSGFCVLN